ncbi:MAG: helicase-exonuclease AddAB subunit AddB [Lachnospiraceae bacterium]|nr:helicase-exonuclease AddAB subunit AddB [Lachnospiraceae bacterium]
MSLQFYIGASGAGKSAKVYRDILERAEIEKNTRFFIVVPDQFTMETQRVLCRLSHTGGIMNVEVMSFGRLAHRVFEELGYENMPRLDDTGKNLILRKVAGEREEELSVIGANIKRTGYIAQVKSMISEFAQYGISPDDLDSLCDVAKGKGSLSAKLKDLQVLYRGYREYISGHFITTEETIDILIKSVKESGLLKGSVLVFDGFTGFTPIQDLLLKELMIYAKQVIVTLLGDTREDLSGEVEEQKLFYLTAKAYHKLERLAEENGIQRDGDIVIAGKPVSRYEKNGMLAHLEANMFRNKRIPQVSGKDGVFFTRCKNPKEEVEWVCLTIRRLIREEQLCYRDIAVITGDLPAYGYLLRETFAEHGIPLFLDQNVSLLFHPFMVFLNGIIRVAVSDFSYESVMTLLRTGYGDMSDEEIDFFENYILKFGIRGKGKYSRAFVRRDDNLEIVNKVRKQLFEMVEPVIKSKKSARAYTKAVYDICVINRLEAKLKDQAKEFEDRNEASRAKEYEQVYKAVIGLLDQIYALLDEPMELEEYGEILKAGFAELKVGSLPQSVDQVVAGDMERTRLKPVKVLFMVGVNDGIVPKTTGSGGLLSDMERNFLLEAGIELAPTPRQKSFEERLYLYMNMTQPADKLILSFCEVNAKGETLRPSYLIHTVEQLFSDVSVTNADQAALSDMVESRESGLKLFSRLLRDYAAGLLDDDKEGWELLIELGRAFYREPEFAGLLAAAFYEYEPKTLPAEMAERLFGEILHTSVSRLEQFAACAYAHFLKYGLKLSEEEEYTFEAVDLGNLFHETLYRFGRHMSEGTYNWFNCPKEEADAFIDKAVDEFAAEYGNTVLYDTARSEALKERAKGILKTTVETLCFQLRKGLFEPVCCEMPFFTGKEVELYGKVDRLDVAKKDGNVYVKVLDYKSGRHKFDPARLFFGLDLQLAVYMNAAVEREEKLFPKDKIVPSAIFYYQIEDPLVEGTPEEGEEARARKIHEQLKVQGLIREEDVVLELLDKSLEEDSQVVPLKWKKNGELAAASQTAGEKEFDLIGRFATLKVEELAGRIQKGEIGVNPGCDGIRSACDYCAYNNICGFEKRIPGYEERDVRMTGEAAYTAMADAVAAEQSGRKEAETDGGTFYRGPAEGN